MFDGADSAIERAKTALGRAGAGGNAETIQSLDEARLQIQEVAHMQKSAAMSMQQGMDLMAIVEQQNQQLRADKAKLAKQKEILERREYIFSLGIIGSLATIIVILVKVFFGWRVRMVTAREDKVLKEQQIEINKLEIAERAIRLQIARRDVERPAQKPHVPTQIDAPSGVLIGPGVADAV